MSEATSEDIFRPEALDYHRKHGDFPEGELLHLDRRWLDRAYWVLGFTVLAALVFCLVAPVHEYASGPAVVRLLGQTRLSAKTGGTVASVEAAPGQHVHPGDVLLRFDETEGQTALNHVEREIEIQTLKLLRDPTDQEARRSLAPLQGQREAAKAHLNESIIRSPIEGVVSDVRVRPWMHLMPGDVMVSLAKGDTHFSVVALLPGEFRPMLRVGMAMRFELSGQRYLYQRLALKSVGNEVVGPSEARRYLGADVADTLTVSGPVVLVQAELPANTFTTEGRNFRYYDGLLGRVDARVRTQSFFMALVPWARRLFNHGEP